MRFKETCEILEFIIVSIRVMVIVLLAEEQLHADGVEVVRWGMSLTDHFRKLLLLAVVVLLNLPRLLIDLFE